MSSFHSKVPKTIRIGQRIIAVEIKPTGEKGLAASYHFYKDKITLSPKLTESLMRSSLLHEVMHAITFIYGNQETYLLPQGKKEKYGDYYQRIEHHFIGLYDENLTMVLRDNPDFTAFLLGSDDIDEG